MLPLFRLLFTGLFVWLVIKARDDAQASLADDLGNAWNFALVVLAGIAASVTWAPLLGARVAEPMTDILTDGSVLEHRNQLMRLIRWCERRRWHRAARWLCFVEGVRHPHLPAQFVIGMHHARPGSWLEKVFAQEVYKFSNVANAARARDILRLRHDADPGPHSRVEVNLALLSDERVERPEPEIVPVPPAAPEAPLTRNPGIKLFAGADKGPQPMSDGGNDAPASGA